MLLDDLESFGRLYVVAGREEVVEQHRDTHLEEDPVHNYLQDRRQSSGQWEGQGGSHRPGSRQGSWHRSAGPPHTRRHRFTHVRALPAARAKVSAAGLDASVEGISPRS